MTRCQQREPNNLQAGLESQCRLENELIRGEKSSKVLKERRREHVHISCAKIMGLFSVLIKGPRDLFMKIPGLNLPPFV